MRAGAITPASSAASGVVRLIPTARPALDICRDLDVPTCPLATRADLDTVVAEVERRGRRALPLVADLRSPAEVEAAVRETERTFGRLDILVNNAAVVTSAPFWELSEPQWSA